MEKNGREFKVNIGVEHINMNLDSLSGEEEHEEQIKQSQIEKKQAEKKESKPSLVKGQSINLFDDNILDQISLMLEYLNMEEEHK